MQKLILCPNQTGETELWSSTNIAACDRSKVDANNSSWLQRHLDGQF